MTDDDGTRQLTLAEALAPLADLIDRIGRECSEVVLRATPLDGTLGMAELADEERFRRAVGGTPLTNALTYAVPSIAPRMRPQRVDRSSPTRPGERDSEGAQPDPFVAQAVRSRARFYDARVMCATVRSIAARVAG